jgi:hypothetical protein
MIPETPIPPPMNWSPWWFVDPRPMPVVTKSAEPIIPASASTLLGYDLYGLRTRARLNHMGHVIASGGWAAEL